MLYAIRHTTTYLYRTDVSAARCILHLQPATGGSQRVFSAHLLIDPKPVEYVEARDFFGNRTAHVRFGGSASRHRFESHVRIDVRPSEPPHALLTPAWREARQEALLAPDLGGAAPAHYLFATRFVPLLEQAQAYARGSFEAGRPVLDGTVEAMSTDGRTAIVCDPKLDRLHVADVQAKKIVWTLEGIGSPRGVNIAPDGRSAFVTLAADETMGVIDLEARKLTRKVKVEKSPDGVWFGPVAMQPGKPQGFGVVGEDETPILTLPGNPVSAYISFELFVLPALRKMMGKRPFSRESTRARLTHGVSSPDGRRQFLRGSYDTGRGGPVVEPVGGAGSHLVGDLAQANCLIVVPEDVTAVSAGEQVQVLLLDGEF